MMQHIQMYSNVSTQLIIIFNQIYSTHPFVSNINIKYDNLNTKWAQYVPLYCALNCYVRVHDHGYVHDPRCYCEYKYLIRKKWSIITFRDQRFKKLFNITAIALERFTESFVTISFPPIYTLSWV